MYKIRTPDDSKRDPCKRWALPDRAFFAYGACHILAWAFLDRYPASGRTPLWIRSTTGKMSHIVVASDRWIFDYHGYCGRSRYLDHVFAKARHRGPAWSATLVELEPEVLISEERSRTYDDLWLREPGQFLHGALPRARRFRDRFPPPHQIDV